MGKVVDIITNIVMFFMRGKIKQIEGLIDPEQRKEVAKAAKELQEAVERYNKMLNKPSVRKSIEDSGGKVEDYYIDKL